MQNQSTLLKDFRDGNRRALARLLTYVENRDPAMPQVLDELFSLTGNAWRIGLTGPPGAGKSTIVNKLVMAYRQQEKEVGVVAFDPTSPFTGGALLGDRVRMEKLFLDPGVFIRSMATRGHLGGLAVGVDEAGDLMDAFGKDRVLFETVGVGQSELEVAHSADTTIVVLVPQSGDSIQAMKAGLMEIADIFILNKCDRDGADRAYRELKSILEMKHPEDGWAPPVIQTIAEQGDGIDEVIVTIKEHQDHLKESGVLDKRRANRFAEKTQRLVEDTVAQKFWTRERRSKLIERVELAASPYGLAETLVQEFYREIRHDKE